MLHLGPWIPIIKDPPPFSDAMHPILSTPLVLVSALERVTYPRSRIKGKRAENFKSHLSSHLPLALDQRNVSTRSRDRTPRPEYPRYRALQEETNFWNENSRASHLTVLPYEKLTIFSHFPWSKTPGISAQLQQSRYTSNATYWDATHRSCHGYTTSRMKRN